MVLLHIRVIVWRQLSLRFWRTVSAVRIFYFKGGKFMLTKNAKKMLSVVLSIIIALSACLNSCYINAYAEVYYQSKTVQDSYAELHNYVY